MVRIKFIIFLIILFFVPFAFSASDSSPTGYFGALWDFIDWVYEVMTDIKQTIFDYLSELSKVALLWYIEIKISSVQFIWSVVEPLIDSLNLTDIITNLFSGLSPDTQMLITEFRVGESVNLLLSAYGTRSILRSVGW